MLVGVPVPVFSLTLRTVPYCLYTQDEFIQRFLAERQKEVAEKKRLGQRVKVSFALEGDGRYWLKLHNAPDLVCVLFA